MALINRVSRLFTADLHAVLDRIEEPEILLKQAIREMEESLASTDQRIRWLEHERDELTGRCTDIEQALVEIDEQLGVCFESGEEQLARTLIRRKLESQRLLKQVGVKVTANAKELDVQRTARDENGQRLDSMRQKAELLSESASDTYAGADVRIGREFAVGDDEVEVAFLREKQRRTK